MDSFWSNLDVAFEIIDTRPMLPPEGSPQDPILTYKSGQDPSISFDTSMSADEWEDYEPPEGYLKNSTRNLQFNQSHFLNSPGESAGVVSYISTADQPDTPQGYTWASMSKVVNAMWPYDSSQYEGISRKDAFYAGALTLTPPPGVVKMTINEKPQYMKFWAHQDQDSDSERLQRYQIFDPWGNGYFMHASGNEDPADVKKSFKQADLPAGWSKKILKLKKDFVLEPAFSETGGEGRYNYNLIRDSSDNAYHQFKWSTSGTVAMSKVESLEIWGGTEDDLLTGDHAARRGSADQIHGAQGNDKIKAGKKDDRIWGDAGRDKLFGQNGDDIIDGGSGRDRLRGGKGDDTMSGGDGADYFYLSKGVDRVLDFSFEGGDRLKVSDLSVVTASRRKDLLIYTTPKGEMHLVDVPDIEPMQVFDS